MASGTTIQLDGLEVEVEADGVARGRPWERPRLSYRVSTRAEDGYIFETAAWWGRVEEGAEREFEAVAWLVLGDLLVESRQPRGPLQPWTFRRRMRWRSAWRENVARHER